MNLEPMSGELYGLFFLSFHLFMMDIFLFNVEMYAGTISSRHFSTEVPVCFGRVVCALVTDCVLNGVEKFFCRRLSSGLLHKTNWLLKLAT